MSYDYVYSWSNAENLDFNTDFEDQNCYAKQEGPWDDVSFMIERFKNAGAILDEIRNDPNGFTETGEDYDDEGNPAPRYAQDPAEMANVVSRIMGQKANSVTVNSVNPGQASPIPETTPPGNTTPVQPPQTS